MAADDSFTLTGNTPITFTAAQLIGNDFDPNGPTPGTSAGLTVSLVAGSATHGTVVDNGNGTYTYTPTTGYSGPASFQYKVVDAEGLTSNEPATVNLTVNDPVWYVDSAAAPGGDGSYGHAFQTIAQATAVDSANDTIFVTNRGTAYTSASGVVLESGEQLLGDGSDLTTVNGNAVGASASNASISVTGGGAAVTLNSGNTVSGVSITSAGIGITDNGGSVGTLHLKTVGVSTTSGTGILLDSGGTVDATGTNTIVSTTGTALNVTNANIGAAELTFQSISAGTGAAGPTAGIILNATGSAGGLTVTGTGTAGSGGTIQHATNGISATDTDQLSLSWMTITDNGRNQTQAGSSTSVGGDLRGGNNLAAVANVNLKDVNGVTLDHVTVTNSGQIGINGNNVSGLTLSNSNVSNNGNEDGETGLLFQNLTGTSTMSDTIVQDNAARQIYIANTASNSTLNMSITGTLTKATFPTADTSTTIIGHSTANASDLTPGQGLLFESGNSASTNVNMGLTVDGVLFNNNVPGNAMDVQMLQASGVLTGGVTNSSFDRNAGGVIVSMQNGSSAQTSSFNVTNNEFNRVSLQSVLYAAANPYASNINGVITGNTFGTSGVASSGVDPSSGNVAGIQVNFIGGTGTISTRIQNNTLQQLDGTYISVRANGAGHVNSIIDSNTLQQPAGSGTGLNISMGTTSGSTAVGNFQITNNTISGNFPDPGSGEHANIITNVRFNAQFNLVGYTGGSTAWPWATASPTSSSTRPRTVSSARRRT